jgi:type IV pilus assembly protein PilA
MIAVAIIAVLATLAVVGYRKLINSSHTSEATHMIGSIRVAQETFHSETGQYANISPGIGLGSLYPLANAPTDTLTSCGVCADPQGWNRLPVHADGPVRFGYATVAGIAGTAPGVPAITFNGNVVNWPAAANITSDWYIVTAMADMDGNAVYCTMMGTSWDKQIFFDKDGE